MLKELHVTLTEDRHHRPLVVVNSQLGPDLELSPARLRGLAQALLLAADDCEARDLKAKHLKSIDHYYPIVERSLAQVKKAVSSDDDAMATFYSQPDGSYSTDRPEPASGYAIPSPAAKPKYDPDDTLTLLDDAEPCASGCPFCDPDFSREAA